MLIFKYRIILCHAESETEDIEKFDKILYNGNLENSIVSHETITLANFNESNILLMGGEFCKQKICISRKICQRLFIVLFHCSYKYV